MNKSNRNEIREPLFLIMVTVLILFSLSFINTSFNVGNFNAKKISIVSDVIVAPATQTASPYPWLNDSIEDWLANLLNDRPYSFLVNDSVKGAKRSSTMKPEGIFDFSKDSIGTLANFFRALVSCKQSKKKVRVAYFGDSMIEGDLLTQDFRQSLQSMFGGRGVGFVPITSIVAGFRRTIIHSFSSDWSDHSLIETSNESHPLGLSGHVFSPSAGSHVTYKAPSYYSQLNSFKSVKLYYGTGNANNTAQLTLDTAKKEVVLSGTDAVNELVLNENAILHSVKLEFNCSEPQNVFGVSFEDDAGVYVDNYSFRGNSGLALTKIPYSVFRGFNKYLNYDLIVLQYGLNTVGHDQKDYSWYSRGLSTLLDYLKNIFPNSSILLISVGDKSWKSPDGWTTEPDIPILVETQKKAAQTKGIAFWNLYEAMGGKNSMTHWVEGDTLLATPDYAHLNYRGAKRISDQLFRQLMKEFSEYEKKINIQQ